ncbi:MAG: hypothetical protein AAF039_10105 [Bacteroidota bacterium]
MKKRFLLFALFSLSLFFTVIAQERYDDLVKVGDELLIGNPSKVDYQFIEIPRKNFIIKRGGIINMGSLLKNKVTVTNMTFDKNSNPIVVLKRSNGSKFFNALRILKADLNGAISSGELRFKNASKSGEIAK